MYANNPDLKNRCGFNLCFSLVLFSLISCNEFGDKTNRPSPPVADTSLVQTTTVIIDYSSPSVKKRKIIDGLIPYNKIWRTGANEATKFICSKDLLVMGQLLPKGTYSYFTMASEGSWTIIFNKDWDQWGSYNYEEEMDALRIEVYPYRVDEFQEKMSIRFEEEQIIFHWGNFKYSIELEEAS